MSTTPLTVETPYTYEDFTPICEVSSFSPEIAVKADSDYQTLDDLLTAIKENPGTITYASQSVAGAGNCAFQPLISAEELDVIHIPSGGDAASVTELLGGHVDFIVGGPYKSYVESGEVRVLASLGTNKITYLDDGTYEILADRGIKTVGDSYSAVAGPAGMDDEVVAVLEDAFQKITEDDEFKDVLDGFGLPVVYKNSEDTKKDVESVYKNTYEIFKELGVDMVVE